MAIKHFDSNFFNEIITGMRGACDGIEMQQLLDAATKIYLAGSSIMNEVTVKEGSWREDQLTTKCTNAKRLFSVRSAEREEAYS